MGASFELNGFGEMQEELENIMNAYPEKSKERLQKVGRSFKRRVVKITKSKVKKRTGNLIKGYKLDKVEGYGATLEQNFRGTAPHFHLIENGHEQIIAKNPGAKKEKDKQLETVGFVPGLGIVAEASREFKQVMPDEMHSLLDDITKDWGR